MAQAGLATTTACGHEVQGRELAGDRHVGFSVHHCGGIVGCLFGWLRVRSDLPHDTLRGSWGTRSGCGQEMAGGGVGALVEALGIFLNLLEGFAVRREMGVGLVEQEKVIVPFAQGFLGGLVAGGEGGGGFGVVDAGLGEIAGGFGSFA